MHALIIAAGLCDIAAGLLACFMTVYALMTRPAPDLGFLWLVTPAGVVFLVSGVLILRGSRAAALVSAAESLVLALLVTYGLAHMDQSHAPQLTKMLVIFIALAALSVASFFAPPRRPAALPHNAREDPA